MYGFNISFGKEYFSFLQKTISLTDLHLMFSFWPLMYFFSFLAQICIFLFNIFFIVNKTLKSKTYTHEYITVKFSLIVEYNNLIVQ